MPPRIVKRGAAARKAKASSKAALENQRQQQEPEPVEEVVVKNHEENPVVDDAVVEEKPIDAEDQLAPEGVPDVTNNAGEVKESIDEFENDEHLDLEDNDPEYGAEEYGGVDYDGKEIEQDEDQEVGDEVDEEPEEFVVEEEGDSADEEVEYVYEEVEGDDEEEEVEHAGEESEHEHLGDVEEEEHHEIVKERKKRKEFEVFVGGLDKAATEHDLKKVFSKVGVITEVRLMMNPQTKRNKGFAFLRFETVEQAKKALVELKNPVINGKQCGVAPCQDSDTLYLGNICKTWKKEALKKKLKHYGVKKFENLTLEEGGEEGTNRGFAFLEFSTRSDAKEACRLLQKRDVMFGVDKPAKVSFADSFIDPNDETMEQVKTVFIDSLPPSWDENYVRDLLKKYGEIEKIELAKDMLAARRKDFGFVTFGTHAAAVECADSITSKWLGEGDKKAKVRARLSRPLQRSRGRHAVRGDSRAGRITGRLARPLRSRPALRNLPPPSVRRIRSRVPPIRPSSLRDRRPVASMPVRARPVAPPARSYDRRFAAPAYPKSSMKRYHGRHEDLQPQRSRVSADYGSRMASQGHPSLREYPAHGSDYPELHRNTSRAAPGRVYPDDGYGQRLERHAPPPPPHVSYHEGRPHDYGTLSGSKRPYTAIDDVPPRYADADAHQSRSRLEYDYRGSASKYGDAYGDRHERSTVGYSGSRSSISIQNSHGTYSSRQATGYGGGSFGGGGGGLYSSSYGGDYIPRGSDVGGSTYSSIYSGRGGSGSSSYMGGGGTRSYY
ncbi:uncharacterized protein LOC130728426 isoform X2 [Lotus japonicus]|uniref:uncharacterized protein LOC130728426 isoform X2 n=1 Tax=Lotus japonicus TaxID=34305 RepID=UPI0025840F0B|nr:uncharacterized protein LOC130728426 isoform X2 [Lotus japonicus]